MATSTDARCIHCDAALTARDLSDGWCDSCGKRLPTGTRPAPAAKVEAPMAAPAPGGAGWRPLVWGGVAFLMLGAAAAFAAANAG